ncbi:hypothetical protein [Streptomyces roseolilacinus]|uniref:hypothetical protein n=1 Tax=Streptomyces roseolilacinus TaxID=66904 RepID=UPI0016773B0F|nr:hypothetical protein [Streptomyces roseolilacinus]
MTSPRRGPVRGLGAVFVALLAALTVPARARTATIRLEEAREARRGGGGQAAGEERW